MCINIKYPEHKATWHSPVQWSIRYWGKLSIKHSSPSPHSRLLSHPLPPLPILLLNLLFILLLLLFLLLLFLLLLLLFLLLLFLLLLLLCLIFSLPQRSTYIPLTYKIKSSRGPNTCRGARDYGLEHQTGA